MALTQCAPGTPAHTCPTSSHLTKAAPAECAPGPSAFAYSSSSHPSRVTTVHTGIPEPAPAIRPLPSLYPTHLLNQDDCAEAHSSAPSPLLQLQLSCRGSPREARLRTFLPMPAPDPAIPQGDPNVACPGTPKTAPDPALAGLPNCQTHSVYKVMLILSAETLQARRECQDIFKGLQRKNFQLRILYPERLSFRLKERERSFQTRKTKRVYHYTGLTRNAEVLSLVEEKTS